MKQKSKPIRLLSFILTFILLIGSISVPKNLYADESDDVSGILEKDVILMQDGNIVLLKNRILCPLNMSNMEIKLR